MLNSTLSVGQLGKASRRLVRLVRLPFRYKLWHAKHLGRILDDMLKTPAASAADNRAHLVAALDWLCLAQDVRDQEHDAGSVSAAWSFEDGWLPGYPETTGYIIETFIDAAAALENPALCFRAHRMIDWELTLQYPDGAFPGHYGEPGSKPVIFNTGQIMHGLLAGYARLNRPECLNVAVKAGLWLTTQQDDDGCWRRSQHNDIPHTYDTRASWALLRTGLEANEAALQLAAKRQLDWALQQQHDDGWFANNAFTASAAPFTHTIAYAISGLLESGLLLDDGRYLEAARKAARALVKLQRSDGWLGGAYGPNWSPQGKYCCLTGAAQMVINWMVFVKKLGEAEFLEPARRALAYVKRHHRTVAKDLVLRGGVPGSYPIWGAYERFCYPAWAAKFFADAIMLIGSMEEC